MKDRKLILSLSLSLLCLTASAQRPDNWFSRNFRIALEWGYSQCLWQTWDYNYYSEEGSRIFSRGSGVCFRPNGQVLARISYGIGSRFDAAVCAGYAGLGEDNRLLPLQLRLSWFPRTRAEDGLFSYLQGGPGWHIRGFGRPTAWLGSLGGGYRLVLSDDGRLDFQFGIKLGRDHPPIPNPEAPGHVEERNILRNDAGYCALDLTIAVSF